tara:strand:- start:611 stop:1558 length:948 start_codon:yes stop_codon:yes gene_type:complete
MSKSVDIMGHIAMWKGKRISSIDIDLVFDKYPSVDRPDVPIEKNFLHTLKRAMADWGKFEINKMWRAWDRTDVNRNVYEIVRKTNEHLHTVYREPFYVKLGVDLKTFYLYATRDDLMNDNKWVRDPLEKQDADNRLLWYHDRIAKHWDVYRNTYDSTLINHMIRDFMNHYLYVKELSPRVVWMNNSSALIWKDLSRELSSVGIQLLDFPPSHSADSIASLFKVVKQEFEDMSREIVELEKILSNPNEDEGDIKFHAEQHSKIIAKYRKEVETLTPVFAGMAEFEELAERNSKKTKRMTYENEVAKNSDLFDDIVL